MGNNCWEMGLRGPVPSDTRRASNAIERNWDFNQFEVQFDFVTLLLYNLPWLP